MITTMVTVWAVGKYKIRAEDGTLILVTAAIDIVSWLSLAYIFGG